MSTMRARLSAGLVALGAVAALASGCSDDEAGTAGDTRAETPSDFVEVETAVGTVMRPEAWQPNEQAVTDKVVAAFTIEADGRTVGQFDVIVDKVQDDTTAQGWNAANQGSRALHTEDLEHVRQEKVEVPGARSAYLDESTYAAGDLKAHSLEQVGISPDNDLMLVRLSVLEEHYDEEIAEAVVDSMEMVAPAAS